MIWYVVAAPFWFLGAASFALGLHGGFWLFFFDRGTYRGDKDMLIGGILLLLASSLLLAFAAKVSGL